MKKYTLDTSAPFEIVRGVAIDIAMKHGHVAELSEAQPAPPPRHVWTRRRWLAVIVTLAAAPFVLRYINASGLQGFFLGWSAAVIVTLARR